MTELSVQVPVKNGGSSFELFLRSLSLQQTSFSWELIIVDDGSSIPVQTEFIQSLAALPESCTVKVIRLDPGGNRPAARNAALEASESPVGLLMDADLEFAPNLLQKHLEIREKTGAEVVMGKRVNSWKASATPWQKWMDSRAMGDSPAGSFPWKYFITGNVSVSCSCLREAGGFDTAINRYGGEDTEMGFRLESMGTSFHWDPSLQVNHLDDVTVRAHSRKMMEYGETGLRYTLNKHPEIRNLLGSRWVDPLLSAPIYLFPMRILTGIALHRAVYGKILDLAERKRCPSVVYTYLSVAACLAGLSGRDLCL